MSQPSPAQQEEEQPAHPYSQAWFLEQFQCLGDACEDTCCKGWGMQLTAETVAKYRHEAPELLEAVDSGESDYIMKRDSKTDYCIKYDQGWCGIHSRYGTDFLGDACHFYPRVTRKAGDSLIMSGLLSCPEIVRLALFSDTPEQHFHQRSTERVPFSLKTYQMQGLDGDGMMALHQAFLDAAGDGSDTSVSAAFRLRRMRFAVEAMQRLTPETLPQAAGFYLSQGDSRLAKPEPHPADAFNLLNVLCSLLAMSKNTARPRLDKTIADMEQALGAPFDKTQGVIQISPDSPEKWRELAEHWQCQWHEAFEPMLQRWLYVQLSAAFFPFAGLGQDWVQRITIIAVRFATLRLALMSASQVHGGVIDEAEQVRIVQSLARFLDHLADPTVSWALYEQSGWTKEGRLAGLLDFTG